MGGTEGSDWTVRGVLMGLSGLPLVFGYGYLCPRLVGQTPAEFWSGPGDGSG